MKKFWVVLIGMFALSFVGLAVLWSSLSRLEAPVNVDGDVLYWIVDGAYPEQMDESPFAWLLTGGGPTHIDMLQALEAASFDPAIEGLFLEVHALPASLAQVQELSEAVSRFRARGKFVQAWISAAGNREYLLAINADDVAVAPEGLLVVPGLSAEMTFLTGALDKLGMEADYVHIGRYKSAPETYELREPSEPHREMIDSLLDDQYVWLVNSIAGARDMTPETVTELIDQGLFDALGALDAGLVDGVAYLPETLDEAFPAGDTVDLEDYAQARVGRSGGPEVALIHVTGTIVDGESSRGTWQGPSAGSWTVMDELQAAHDDDGVAAVLIRIDSPGGSALASDLIWNEIRALREVKPVFVSMGGLAASGGYYVACGADSVFASGGTITGSIGVFAGKMDRSGFYEKIGVTRSYSVRGRNAKLYRDDEAFTPDQRRLLTAQLSSFYERFVTKVSEGRGLERQKAAEAAEGRVWSGRQALDLGLVDDLGGFHRSQDALRFELGLSADDALNFWDTRSQASLLERLLMKSMGVGRVDFGADVVEVLAEAGQFAPVILMLDGRPLALHPVGIQLH